MNNIIFTQAAHVKHNCLLLAIHDFARYLNNHKQTDTMLYYTGLYKSIHTDDFVPSSSTVGLEVATLLT